MLAPLWRRAPQKYWQGGIPCQAAPGRPGGERVWVRTHLHPFWLGSMSRIASGAGGGGS